MAPILIGIAAGLTGALALARLLASILYEVRLVEPWVMGTSALVLASVAIVSALVPAIAAARVEPVAALRSD